VEIKGGHHSLAQAFSLSAYCYHQGKIGTIFIGSSYRKQFRMTPFEKAQSLYEKSMSDSIGVVDLDAIIAWPQDELFVLFAAADQVRRANFSNSVDPCSLMNIKSGGCSEDCAFCSQSGHNHANVAVRDLASVQDIIVAGRAAHEKGLTFCVVSSGRRLQNKEIRTVAGALAELGASGVGELHASLGILTEEEFRLLKAAGVVCYNHNLETSRRYYGRIVTTHAYDDRVATVKAAKRAGLKVCCGGIFGMGETWEDRKSLCWELKCLDVDTIPINFLMPIAGTRLKPPQESPMDFLRIIALFRLAHPHRTIKVCGGRELNLGKLQSLIFLAGANGYVSGDYLTTKGDSIQSDDEMITMLGLVKKHSMENAGN
jgi:biotin synthase